MARDPSEPPLLLAACELRAPELRSLVKLVVPCRPTLVSLSLGLLPILIPGLGMPVPGPGIPDVGVLAVELAPDLGFVEPGVLCPGIFDDIPGPLLRGISFGLVAVELAGRRPRLPVEELIELLTEVEEEALLGMDVEELALLGSSLLVGVPPSGDVASFLALLPNVFLNLPSLGLPEEDAAAPAASACASLALAPGAGHLLSGPALVGDLALALPSLPLVALAFAALPLLLLSLSLNSLNLSNIDF